MHSGEFVEQLESRVLMTATTTVTAVVADNRGLVNIYFSGPLNPATVTSNTVSLFTAGQDGQLNTADDVLQPAAISYGGGEDRIIIDANLTPNTPYWVLVRGNSVLDANGNKIDGEYSGTLPSGNGVPGGSFEFDANVAPVNSQVAVFYFNGGQHVNVDLDNDAELPLSIPNFLYYVNSGTYDGTLIHRIADEAGLQIVQGGAFFVKQNPVIGERSPIAPIAQEPAFSNTIGTLAMANTGNPDSTSDEWYFNVGDDSDLDGNYSVIGTIANSAGLSLLTTIDDIPTAQQMDLATTINDENQSVYGTAAVVGQLQNVPTFNPDVVPGTVNPATDFIIVHRVAIRDYITAITGSPAVVSAAKTSAAIFADGMVIGSAVPAIAPLTATTINSALSPDPDKLKL
jgi:cyclophilin family peptidyl-prolyl cis-trans isomerase